MATSVGQGKYGRYIIEDPKLVKDMLFHDLSRPKRIHVPRRGLHRRGTVPGGRRLGGHELDLGEDESA